MGMVNRVTSLTGSGVKDWIIQRLSAVVLLLYVLFWIGYWVANPQPTYAQISWLFSQVWMRWATLIVAFMVVFHAWVGMWTVLTDYVKCAFLRQGLQFLFVLAYVVYIIWCIHVLWG